MAADVPVGENVMEWMFMQVYDRYLSTKLVKRRDNTIEEQMYLRLRSLNRNFAVKSKDLKTSGT